MRRQRRRAVVVFPVVVAAALAACTFPPLETPIATSVATPVASASPSAAASTSAGSSASATPDPAAVPDLTGGDIVATTVAGLRVRRLAGTEHPVIADLLPADAELAVVMGPITADGLGWYLVTDADAEPPEFEEGWVAAGFEPEPNVRATGKTADGTPVVASVAGTGDAEFGPFAVPDENHIIRWVAVDPQASGCQFSVMLAAGAGEPLPAIRSPLGADLVVGTLPSSYFVAQPTLRGQLFLSVASDCEWALAIMEERVPEPSTVP
jgi:hypothetical protein